jgi:hypothetical protein
MQKHVRNASKNNINFCDQIINIVFNYLNDEEIEEDDSFLFGVFQIILAFIAFIIFIPLTIFVWTYSGIEKIFLYRSKK